MDIQKHVISAEECIRLCEANVAADPEYCQAQAQIAIAHLLIAGVKLALNTLGGSSRPGALGMLLKLAK